MTNLSLNKLLNKSRKRLLIKMLLKSLLQNNFNDSNLRILLRLQSLIFEEYF